MIKENKDKIMPEKAHVHLISNFIYCMQGAACTYYFAQFVQFY